MRIHSIAKKVDHNSQYDESRCESVNQSSWLSIVVRRQIEFSGAVDSSSIAHCATPAAASPCIHIEDKASNGEVCDILPIEEHRLTLLQNIRNNQVTCIQGETGCGKSSMIPQVGLSCVMPSLFDQWNHFYCPMNTVKYPDHGTFISSSSTTVKLAIKQ